MQTIVLLLRCSRELVDQGYSGSIGQACPHHRRHRRARLRNRAGLSQALRDVATAPGEKILPGEWSKAAALIKAGTDIDYDGAGGPADFDKAGDVDGIIVEVGVTDGKFVEIGPVK